MKSRIFAIAGRFKEEGEGVLTSLAAAMGSISMLKWLQENNARFGSRTCSMAAKAGHFELLKWLHQEQECPIDRKSSQRAAKGGHLDILKWLQKEGYPICGGCSDLAAKRGHIEVMIWLETGTRWEQVMDEHIWAVKGGRLDVLKWLRANRHYVWARSWNAAAERGDLEILDWLKQNTSIEAKDYDKLCEHAASGGHLEVLKWLRENEFPLSHIIWLGAAEKGQVGVLKWANENNIPRNDVWKKVIFKAAASGILEALKWMKEADEASFQLSLNGRGSILYHAMITGGNVEMMKWLKEIGSCRIGGQGVTELACYMVAKEGNLEMLKWMREIGYKWNSMTTSHAAEEGHLELLEWALLNGCPYDVHKLKSPPFIQRWLRRNGYLPKEEK